MRNMLMRKAFFLLIFALAACSPQPVFRDSNEPLPVADVDIERYLGLWHEQARLPNRFERGCQLATAEYARRQGGGISVVNTCTDGAGAERVARGRARAVGREGGGRFEVSFFWPFWSDYWVLDRAEDYSWAIVGEPDGKYLWVLTRTARITPERRAAFERRISELGYRPAELVWSAQSHVAAAG